MTKPRQELGCEQPAVPALSFDQVLYFFHTCFFTIAEGTYTLSAKLNQCRSAGVQCRHQEQYKQYNGDGGCGQESILWLCQSSLQTLQKHSQG